jgi:alpha/beta superfamily hydrolase
MSRLSGNGFIDGPQGPLEAIIKEVPDGGGRAAIICHPHPLYGGTMHNKVVYRIARTFQDAGFTTLRFNFRGVGLSAGQHDDGNGEQDDLRAVIGFAQSHYPGHELWLAGFSFGSAVMLKVGCRDNLARALVAAGVPVSMYELDRLGECESPKLFVHGSQDEFGPVDKLRNFFEKLAEPKELAVIESADHFFTGHLDEMAAAISRFIQKLDQQANI